MTTHSPHSTRTKMPTGILGFDDITDGGMPRERTSLVMGGPGSGKTIFALQSLVNGARQSKEAGIFVAFEESTAHILANAATFGWDLPALQPKKLLFFDAQLSPEVVKAGEFDLVGMLNLLRITANRMKATRIVFDGIDVLLNLLNDPVAERRELYRIREWMAETGLTGIITQKVTARHEDSRYDFLQFMVDCVVVLQHRMVDGSSFRNLRVMKYRGSTFVADEFPITIGSTGLELTHRGPNELSYKVSAERISSGLPRLDSMLRGGYHRGSNVLISGAPGTAKSTLAGLFAATACNRGERVLYVSFDEGAAQIVRNLRSVGIRLAPHLRSGVLKMYSTRTRGHNVEEQFSQLRRMVRAHGPRCVVIDPLSALSSRMAHLASSVAAQQFLDFLKGELVTVVNTSLLSGPGAEESTVTGISTIADTWIHLSYVVHEGERNRALTVVKSRGTGHSNQVRELMLADGGVDLTDVFIAQGKVLMGVARWEWEQEERAATERGLAATEDQVRQLKLAQAEAAARMQVVRTEMDSRRAEIAVLSSAAGSAAAVRKTDRTMIRKLRHADRDGGGGRGKKSAPRRKTAGTDRGRSTS